MYTKEIIAIMLLILLDGIEQVGGMVGFLWVPAHVGAEGKEMADMAAKRALRGDVELTVDIRITDCHSVIRDGITAQGQKQ